VKGLAWGPLTTIRFRLGTALTLALLPVLLLAAAQAGLSFRKEAETKRLTLALAAERGAATARARMASAQVLIETLAPEAVGYECVQRLSELTQRLPGYENLIRYDAQGRVACAAATVGGGATRESSGWFERLRGGQASLVIAAPASLNRGRPALLAAQAARDPQGRFDGALAAVIDLASLQPELIGRALQADTQINLVDAEGRPLTRPGPRDLIFAPKGFAERVRRDGAFVYYGHDSSGDDRVFSAAPLAGDVFIILSAPTEGWFSWARLNPLSGLLFPLLSFFVALAAVWFAVERVVVRWLNYLQRIAAIYAKGRFTVRPVQADHAPPEVRELAHALELMADAIAIRDASLLDSLAQKDDLMREIHHRVKNNLQVIASLLSMQQRALTDPSARAAMADTRQRIAAMALIYRALYQGPDLKRVDLRTFLGDLLGQMITDHQHETAPIRTELDADELNIDPDKLAPLALFAVEAIGNAQKHALAQSGGVLHIRFTVQGEEAELLIADEGAGEAAEPSAESIGPTLMAAFARQLRGRMEVTANPRGGVSTRLIFPTPRAPGESEAGRSKVKPKRNPSLS
jgi:two-component sensor histidine kinase